LRRRRTSSIPASKAIATPTRPGRLPTPTLQENNPLPEVLALLAMPVTTGETQSGVPSSRTTQLWSFPLWSFPQRTCSQGLITHLEVWFTHNIPAGQAMLLQGLGLHLPVVTSQKDSLSHVSMHADFAHFPFEQVSPAPQTIPAQLGTQAPALQSCPAEQVLFAQGFTVHWRPIQLRPAGQPCE
jgi:hypothetical protein